MNKLLTLYPAEFQCFTKFARKFRRIVQNMSEFSVIYPADPNLFIKLLCDDEFPNAILIENLEWDLDDFTHAIIFDDGQEFTTEIEKIVSSGKPLRLIEIAITRVINIKKETGYQNIKSTPEYEYIGRGSYWGNPYSMYEDGDDREEVIRKYKYDFDFDNFPNKQKKEVFLLAGKRLGCFCKPETCHGDILAGFLNSWDDGK